jgi:hypothetical protein
MITKDINKSIEIIKEQKLTKKSVQKANERQKNCVFALNGAYNLSVTKKNAINNKINLGFCAVRSMRVRSIALKVCSSASESLRLLWRALKRWR